MDIFSGSNTTGEACEKLNRRWKCFELNLEYIASSSFRFADSIEKTSDYYNKIVIDNILKICINATLTYFYTLIIATLYCNIKAGKHIPKYDKDFVIILGSKIREDGTLTPLLKGRVDKAIEFGNKEYEINKNDEIKDVINNLTEEMLKHAEKMEFEEAAKLRDKIKELEKLL